MRRATGKRLSSAATGMADIVAVDAVAAKGWPRADGGETGRQRRGRGEQAGGKGVCRSGGGHDLSPLTQPAGWHAHGQGSPPPPRLRPATPANPARHCPTRSASHAAGARDDAFVERPDGIGDGPSWASMRRAAPVSSLSMACPPRWISPTCSSGKPREIGGRIRTPVGAGHMHIVDIEQQAAAAARHDLAQESGFLDVTCSKFQIGGRFSSSRRRFSTPCT